MNIEDLQMNVAMNRLSKQTRHPGPRLHGGKLRRGSIGGHPVDSRFRGNDGAVSVLNY